MVQERVKVATTAVLEDDPEVVPSFIPIVEFYNIGVPIVKGGPLRGRLFFILILSGAGALALDGEMGDMVGFYLLKYTNFVHELFPAASLHGFDGNVLNALFLSPFVHHRVFASAYFLLNVIIIHI